MMAKTILTDRRQTFRHHDRKLRFYGFGKWSAHESLMKQGLCQPLGNPVQ